MTKLNKKSPDYKPLIDNNNNKNKNNLKKYVFICFFLSFLFGFIISFLLISRNPSGKLLFFNCDNNTCQGTFKFKNNNYYQVTFKNPEISVYWLPYNGQEIGPVCYNDGNVCEQKIKNICAIRLGKFISNYNFKIDLLSSKNKDLGLLNSTSQEFACTTWMLLNSNNEPKIMTSGNVLEKSKIFNYFRKVKINNEYYYIV